MKLSVVNRFSSVIVRHLTLEEMILVLEKKERNQDDIGFMRRYFEKVLFVKNLLK